MLLSLVSRCRYLVLGLYAFSLMPHVGLLHNFGIDLSGTAFNGMYLLSAVLGMALILIRKLVRLVIGSALLVGAYSFYDVWPGFG